MMRYYEAVIDIIRQVEADHEHTWRDQAFFAIRRAGLPCIIEPSVPFVTGISSADLYVPNILLELKIPRGLPSLTTEALDRSSQVQLWKMKLLTEASQAGADYGVLVLFDGPTLWLDSQSGVQQSLPNPSLWRRRGHRASVPV